MILQKNRKAMTLVELIISMTILATIAAIAVISIEDMGETSRYDETDRRGKLIQNTLAGYDTPRFIQDMGRLPLSLVDLTDTSLSDTEILARKKLLLAELIDLEADSELTYSYKNAKRMKRATVRIIPYIGNYIHATSSGTSETFSSANFPEIVSINAGWAGPYALSGSEALTDNWGYPWDIYHYGDDDDTTSTDNVLKWATPTTNAETDSSNDSYIYDTNQEIALGTEIYGIRSIYKKEYAPELAYKFPEDNVYKSITIQICDSSGNIITNTDYTHIRLFVYLPYCPIKTDEDGNLNDNEDNYPAPKIAELAFFYNKTTSEEYKGLRMRYSQETEVDESDNPNTNVTTLYNSNYTQASEGEGEGEGEGEETAYRDGCPDYFYAYLNEDETQLHEFVIENMPVGTRKVWAYAYNNSNEIPTGKFAPLQLIKITKDTEIIQIRLSETFTK